MSDQHVFENFAGKTRYPVSAHLDVPAAEIGPDAVDHAAVVVVPAFLEQRLLGKLLSG